jgi:hypothetical protein
MYIDLNEVRYEVRVQLKFRPYGLVVTRLRLFIIVVWK